MSAPPSFPCVEVVLACLVVESKSNCKFPIVSDFCLIVDSRFHPSRALTRSLEAFTTSTWMYFCYIPRRHEAVATDTVFSDTPAVDSGVKQSQVFVGRDTLVADAYPMKSGKQFVNTLEDNIRRWGAMNKLLSDSAKTEISNKVMDILRAYHISNWYSEPYHQNQNPAEWKYRTIKSWTNTVMNRSGAPANC